MGQRRRRGDPDLRRQMSRVRPGRDEQGVVLAQAGGRGHPRSATRSDVEAVHRLGNDGGSGAPGEVVAHGVDVDDSPTDVDQCDRRLVANGQPEPSGAGMDHLVVRTRLGHRGSPGGHVGARDDALAVDQHRPSGLLAPAVEADLRPLGEAHEVRVDVGEAEDPGRAGGTLTHDRAGLVAVDLMPGVEEGGRGGHADDTGPDHRDPHPVRLASAARRRRPREGPGRTRVPGHRLTAAMQNREVGASPTRSSPL